MRESIRDPQRLDHILEACRKLIDFNASTDLNGISEKDISYYGIVKLLEIIGEAAYKLTPEFKSTHNVTPWKQITDMRHILVHGYYHVNKQDVFMTIQTNIPDLYFQVKKYLKEFE